jgi:uncharacterized alpha-E superfamily protein
VLARHAEDFFWTGRYLERAEDTARMLDVAYHGLLESPLADPTEVWSALLRVLQLEKAFSAGRGAPTGAEVAEFLVLDARNPGSITAAVARARDNARNVRERISTELWEAINTFYLELRARDLRADLERQPYDLYRMVKSRCQTIVGVTAETMVRDDGWRFLYLGRLLERAEMTSRLLSVRWLQHGASDPQETFRHRVALLRSVAAFEAYLRTYGGAIHAAAVLEFLLCSQDFPRSVHFCVRAAAEEIARLAPNERPIHPQRLLGRLRADLEYLDVGEMLEQGLEHFLERFQLGIWEVADAVAVEFFRNGSDGELHALAV